MNIKKMIETVKEHGEQEWTDKDGNHCFASIPCGVESEDCEPIFEVNICKGECVTTEKGLKIWDIVEVFVYDMDGNQIDHWVD